MISGPVSQFTLGGPYVGSRCVLQWWPTPLGVTICHCYACERRTGSVFGAQAGFPRGSVAIEGAGTEFVRVGDEGGRFK